MTFYLIRITLFLIIMFGRISAQITKEQCDAVNKAYINKEGGTTICIKGAIQDISTLVHRPKPLKFSFCFDYEGYRQSDVGRDQSCNRGKLFTLNLNGTR